MTAFLIECVIFVVLLILFIVLKRYFEGKK